MYVCGHVIPVPKERLASARGTVGRPSQRAEHGTLLFKEYGWLEIVECWIAHKVRPMNELLSCK